MKNTMPRSDLVLAGRVYCPFFGYLSNHAITCEFLGKEKSITLKHKNQTEMIRTVVRWCSLENGHKECPIAAANYLFWEKNQKPKGP